MKGVRIRKFPDGQRRHHTRVDTQTMPLTQVLL
jgi:hypothetical protein